MAIDRVTVADWLRRYVEAWRANQPEPIAELFTLDAVYRYRPGGDEQQALRGRDAIVRGWLEEPDPPGSWEASYEPWAVEGDRAVATGWSRYFASLEEPERLYWNCFLLRFADDGRCAEFTE